MTELATGAQRYLPRADSLYRVLASAVALLAIAGAQRGTDLFAVLTTMLAAVDAPTTWLSEAGRWSEAHTEVLALLGVMALALGLFCCGGISAMRSRASSTAALGSALALESGTIGLRGLALLIAVRLIAEWARERWGDEGTLGATTMGLIIGYLAVLGPVLWLVAEPNVERDQPSQAT